MGPGPDHYYCGTGLGPDPFDLVEHAGAEQKKSSGKSGTDSGYADKNRYHVGVVQQRKEWRLKQLAIGALKSFVSGSTGIIVALNIIDPAQFSATTYGGWKHLGLAMLIAGAFSEARFLKQWADAVTKP